jgi:predicted transcriptional regulator
MPHNPLRYELVASDVMSIGVIMVNKNQPLMMVLELMDTKKISSVVIEDPEDLSKYYIISHSDIISFLLKNAHNPGILNVQCSEVMRGPIEVIPLDTPLDEIVSIMFNSGSKRLIVGNENQQPIGFISTRDILSWNNEIFRSGKPILIAVMDNETGIILTQYFFQQTFSQDMLELFGGSITAISAITSEVLQKSGNLRIIEKDYYVILLEPRSNVTGILVADYPSIELRRKLQNFIDDFIKSFSETYTTWKRTSGPTDHFQIAQMLDSFQLN